MKAMEIPDLNSLNRWLSERNLGGHWDAHTPPPAPKPYLWKWADIWEGLEAAGELVPMDATARRTIQLKNPALSRGMTNTIHISSNWSSPERSPRLTATPQQRSAMFSRVRRKDLPLSRESGLGWRRET